MKWTLGWERLCTICEPWGPGGLPPDCCCLVAVGSVLMEIGFGLRVCGLTRGDELVGGYGE